MAHNNACIYAFNKLSRVVDYELFEEDGHSFDTAKWIAHDMAEKNGDIKEIHVVSNRRNLYKDFLNATRSADFTKQVEFKDMIARMGFCAFKR